MLPMKSGSREIISGCNLSNSDRTSASRRCCVVWYGLASRASKLGSPAPGMMRDVNPWEWPTPRTSSKGQKRREVTVDEGIR